MRIPRASRSDQSEATRLTKQLYVLQWIEVEMQENHMFYWISYFKLLTAKYAV